MIFDLLGLELKANTYQITFIKDTLGIGHEKASRKRLIYQVVQEGEGDNSRISRCLLEHGLWGSDQSWSLAGNTRRPVVWVKENSAKEEIRLGQVSLSSPTSN